MQHSNSNQPENTYFVIKSADGGQTWQDISDGLPENLQGDGFFASDSGLYVRAGNGIYHSKQSSTAPFWEKRVFPDQQSGIYAFNFDGQFLQNINGTSGWSPRYMKLVESNGVLMSASQNGIIRSTDGGKKWETVLSEGGVGIAIERIEGGFAAINFNTESKTRRVRTSYDGGKTWQPIDAGLPPSQFISSIIQVGEDFFCGHADGIYRSSDKGKTWKLLLPAKENKVFKLSVSGGVIYAVPGPRGC